MIDNKYGIEIDDNMFKLSFMFNMELNAEALNNEESIGNVVKTRTIQLKDGELRNAITGNLLKHVYSKNLRLLSDLIELCDTCKIFSPMKNGKVKEKDDRFSASGNKVKECVIDDICGFMNAGKGNNEKRFTTAQFSWAIAKEGTRNDSVLYNRVDLSEKNGKTKQEQIKNEDGSFDTTSEANTNKDQNAQMIYYRPIRSSEYALTVSLDLGRIGFDDERMIYTLDKEQIKERIKKALNALRNTIMDIEGAMCNTNMPHLGKVSGIITEKTDRNQKLTKYSALNDDFIEVNSKLSSVCREFKDIVAFDTLIDQYTNDKFLDFIVERNINYIKNSSK
ncbi:MAG: CRISPR-associated autoregulator DevR [Clostridiaceae bacterium]|jgi:CRISPR-associated protein Cst2|nr:CRISPR-associated autoregulator DevR [Clostridiaceae bacterium]